MLPDGATRVTDIVRHPGGAVALPLDEAGRVMMLRQFRPCLGAWLWELPAGKLEPGEPPDITARREMAEEAGLAAASLEKLGEVVTAPGFSDEVLHLYLARGLSPVPRAPEADEHMECRWMPLAAAIALADAGEITDAKTLVALYRCRRLAR